MVNLIFLMNVMNVMSIMTYFIDTFFFLFRFIRLMKIKSWVDENSPGDLLIPMCSALEHRVSLLPTKEEKEELLKSLGTHSALPNVIVSGYKTLQLIYFFTCGPDEVRAWTIRVSNKHLVLIALLIYYFDRLIQINLIKNNRKPPKDLKLPECKYCWLKYKFRMLNKLNIS